MSNNADVMLETLIRGLKLKHKKEFEEDTGITENESSKTSYRKNFQDYLLIKLHFTGNELEQAKLELESEIESRAGADI